MAHAKHTLEKTQTEAYMEFKIKHPEIKMGQCTFESCKPFYIATLRSQDRISCCCRIHVETRMVFQSCMGFRRQISQLPEQYTVYKHLSDLVNEILLSHQCPNEKVFVCTFVNSLHVYRNSPCNYLFYAIQLFRLPCSF